MKKINLIIFILLIGLASGITQDEFTNGNSTEIFTFVGVSNHTRFIEIPRYINSTATIDINAVYNPLDNLEYFVQEVANWTNLTDGVKDAWIDPDNLNDSDFGTFGIQNGNLGISRYWFNYTIPAWANNHTIWYFKYGCAFAGPGALIFNGTLPKACWDYSPTTLHLRAFSGNYPYLFGGECLTSTGWEIVASHDFSHGACGAFWEDSVYWANFTDIKANLSLKVGDETAWEFTGKFNTSVHVNFSSEFNNVLPGCSCTDCSISSGICFVPFLFQSNTTGIMTVSNIEINYTFTDTNLSITIVDAEDASSININMTVQVVGDNYQNETTTLTSYASFIVPFSSSISQDLSIRVFETIGSDYSIVIQEITLPQAPDVYNVTMLPSNTSDVTTTNLVTFHVQDENRNSLQGAQVRIERQNPATAEFLTISEITTDSEGRASTILHTDTVFYKYSVIFEGAIIYSMSLPITISLNDNNIWILGVIEGRFTDYIDTFLDVDTDIDYVNVTNSTGFFTMSFSSVDSVEGCLRVEIMNGTGRFEQDRDCINGTSGTLTSTTFAPTNITLFVAYADIDSNDGEGFKVHEILMQYIGTAKEVLDRNEGTFMIIAVIILAAFGFTANKVGGLLVLIIGSIAIASTKLLPAFDISIAMIIVALASISLFTVVRLKKDAA